MSEARENGLIVLSLDGETDIRIGVLSALYSLRDLMVQVAEGHPELTSGQPSAEPMGSPPEALPSKCFDLIVGSGDGGWVAIMLGRMGMSTSQVIDTYCQIRTSVHDSDFNIDTLSDQQKAAKSAVFEQSLRLLVAANTGRAEEQLRIGNPLCYVAALAMRAENDAPHPVLFRNYEARKSNSPNCSIWFAIRAVASSKSFPPACTTSMSHRFCFLAASQHNFSNPVDEAITEALELAKKLKITGSPPLACLVSLGAGHPGIKPLDDPIDGNVAARLTRNPEKAHEEAQKRIEKQHDLKGTEYFRLNVDQGLQENLLNDIKLEKVLSHTEAYLNTFTVTSKVSRIVEHIVGSIAKRTANSQTNALPTEDPASEFDLMHIYANRLYLLGYGLPLWEPRPLEKVVDVGDVGFVDNVGSFVTLFNILVPGEDQQGYLLPPNFHPFQSMPPGNVRVQVRNNSITRRYLQSGINIVDDNKSSTITWDIKHGAILLLKEKPTMISITRSQPLVGYIIKHQEDWYQSLKTNVNCPVEVINTSRLLLVTGVHRSDDWSLGAWSCTIAPRSISYIDHTAGTNPVSWSPNPPPGIRSGPSSNDHLRNPFHDYTPNRVGKASLFIEGYRLIRCTENQKLRSGINVDANSATRWWNLLGLPTSWNQTPLSTTDSVSPTESLPSVTTGLSGSSLNLSSLQALGNTELPQHPLDKLADLVFTALQDVQTAIIHDQDLVNLRRSLQELGSLPNMDIVRRSLANSGSCAYFVFPLTELPFSDLGPRIAHYAAQLEPTILLSLVLVCKKFHRWCAPILYQSIHLSKGANIGLFSRTISSNPSLAQHVRRILVEGDPIFFFPDFKICGNLCALALFFFCWDTQGRKLDLPPSVVHLACDPQHFIALPPPSPSLETTFQAITHLHLLTKLPTIQFWKWLGRVHAPILSHLAVEHHSNESLRNNSRELMACLTEYLPTQIRLCVLLVISGDTLSNPLDLNSIDLSDGTVDNRVVLGAAFPREPVYKLGYLLNLDLFAIRKTWMSSSLWDEAERVQLERAISGKFPPAYYVQKVNPVTVNPIVDIPMRFEPPVTNWAAKLKNLSDSRGVDELMRSEPPVTNWATKLKNLSDSMGKKLVIDEFQHQTDHGSQWNVRYSFDGMQYNESIGQSRKNARQSAAREAYKILSNEWRSGNSGFKREDE